jgi:hypothetical protein
VHGQSRRCDGFETLLKHSCVSSAQASTARRAERKFLGNGKKSRASAVSTRASTEGRIAGVRPKAGRLNGALPSLRTAVNSPALGEHFDAGDGSQT